MQPSYLPKVKEQYEDYPYPPRDPRSEREVLIAAESDCLDMLNHYGFGGRRNFHERFRILSAGAGTGDTVIFMAEQLKNTQAEIVYLDLSSASMEIAKARAKVRGLDNITWIQGSLLDLPAMDIGKFDFINCTGVLHHLESPEAGLAALESVLAEEGVICIMVYGKYGRAAIYQTQDLLRMLAGEEDTQTRLDVCHKVINRLPKTNWLMHSHSWFGDLTSGDAAVFDLLLHSQDRAYSVPELYDYIEGGGLNMLTLIKSNTYDPLLYIDDPVLVERVKALPLRTQYAIGELLSGNIIKHACYAARDIVPPASPADMDMVPLLTLSSDPVIYEQMRAMSDHVGKTLGFATDSCTLHFTVTPALAAVMKQIDGVTCLGDIYQKAATQGNLAPSDLQRAFREVYDVMNRQQFMFLRHKDVPPYLTTRNIQHRFLQGQPA